MACRRHRLVTVGYAPLRRGDDHAVVAREARMDRLGISEQPIGGRRMAAIAVAAAMRQELVGRRRAAAGERHDMVLAARGRIDARQEGKDQFAAEAAAVALGDVEEARGLRATRPRAGPASTSPCRGAAILDLGGADLDQAAAVSRRRQAGLAEDSGPAASVPRFEPRPTVAAEPPFEIVALGPDLNLCEVLHARDPSLKHLQITLVAGPGFEPSDSGGMFPMRLAPR
jgi:hypothetical protein